MGTRNYRYCSSYFKESDVTYTTYRFEGCAASFIVMLFPPTSGKKAVRLRNASIIREISSIYSFLLSQWVKENGDAESSKALKSGVSLDVRPKWMGAYRKRILGLSTQIQALRQMTTVAKFESGIRGKWRIEEYRNLVETEAQMLGSLAQVCFESFECVLRLKPLYS